MDGLWAGRFLHCQSIGVARWGPGGHAPKFPEYLVIVLWEATNARLTSNILTPQNFTLAILHYARE